MTLVGSCDSSVSASPPASTDVVYVSGGFDDYDDLLPRLGPHSTGKGCLYLKKVAETDLTRCASWSPVPTAGVRRMK